MFPSVGVDEAGHGRQALGVDRLPAPAGGGAGTGGDDLPAAHDNRAALDDAGVGADDADVGDREVLCGQRRRREQECRQRGRESGLEGVSSHAHLPERSIIARGGRARA
jgi:hypothetical protein